MYEKLIGLPISLDFLFCGFLATFIPKYCLDLDYAILYSILASLQDYVLQPIRPYATNSIIECRYTLIW